MLVARLELDVTRRCAAAATTQHCTQAIRPESSVVTTVSVLPTSWFHQSSPGAPPWRIGSSTCTGCCLGTAGRMPGSTSGTEHSSGYQATASTSRAWRDAIGVCRWQQFLDCCICGTPAERRKWKYGNEHRHCRRDRLRVTMLLWHCIVCNSAALWAHLHVFAADALSQTVQLLCA